MGLTFSSCNDYDWDKDNTTTLTAINITSTDENIALEASTIDFAKEDGRSVELKWDRVKAADLSAVYYEVWFYTADEDEPFHKEKTERNQHSNFLTLYEKQLNIIAERAGIAQEKTGTIKWKVFASNGVIRELSEDFKSLTITRPKGFAYVPSELYLMGSGTSAGDDPSKAILMKKNLIFDRNTRVFLDTITGGFDAFVSLGEGNVYLMEKVSDTRFRYFSVSNGALSDGKSEIATIEKGKMHRVSVNFRKETAHYAAIEEVGVWYSGTNSLLGVMTQADETRPVWNLEKYFEVVNRDYRYKFRLKEKNENGDSSYSFWGPDAKTVNSQGSTTEAWYFYAVEVDNSQSDYCYKFNNLEGLHDKKTLNITFNLSSSLQAYTHSIAVIK